MPDAKEKTAVPRLRFPEFRDAGPWEVKRLSEFVRQKSGNSKLIKGKLFSEPAPNLFPGFSASGQDVWLDDFEHSGRAIIVSAVGARCGRCFLADGKWSAIANTHILFPDMAGIDIRFLFEIVTREGFWIISGSGQPFVKVRDSLKQLVLIPSLPEQQKIADCLSSLDDLIRAEEGQLATLKDHKKGLMQQLFPREGETTPRLRFPEFRDAGPWEVKRLGDIGPVSMCKRVMKAQTAPTGDVPFYKIGTFGNQADAYISRELYEEYKSKHPFPKKGDILISAAGTIGRTVVYDGKPAYFQDSNIVWIANDEKIASNKFLNFAYQTVEWRTDDNTISRLYNENLRSIKIPLPSLAEQQKIADCLSSLDEVIELETKKLEALKTHKRGLMQQLFPQEVG